jgi:hypothetical protein
VDENTVGMAMLVHHSTPDDIELANGVATLNRKNTYPQYAGKLVTQLGAVSVANPDGSALPEDVDVFKSAPNNGLYLDLIQYSSLRPRGAYVMDWPTNYQELSGLLIAVGDAYASIATNKPQFVLDLEYKKVSPGRLEVKQVREIPQPASTNIVPYLLNQPATFVNYQGLYCDLWTTHRLKSRWTLSTRTMQLTVSNLTEGVHTDVRIEHVNGTNVQTLSGVLSSFPDAVHVYTNNYASDRWTMGNAAGPAEVELRTVNLLEPVSSRQPFISLADMALSYLLRLHVRQAQPVPFTDNIGGGHELSFQLDEETHLRPELVETQKDTLKEFTFHVAGQGTNVVVRTSFWLGSTETFGDRPPLIRFVETRLEGLTTEPIVLRSYWSQTFSATHNLGQENFIFEPRLEPGLPATQLAELNGANIGLLYLHRNGLRVVEDGQLVLRQRPVLRIIGVDGEFSTFSDVDFDQ